MSYLDSARRRLDSKNAREVHAWRLSLNQEIATHLNLSIKTVQAHRANVMEKLGLHDVTHLVRFAIQHGLIPAET